MTTGTPSRREINPTWTRETTDIEASAHLDKPSEISFAQDVEEGLVWP